MMVAIHQICQERQLAQLPVVTFEVTENLGVELGVSGGSISVDWGMVMKTPRQHIIMTALEFMRFGLRCQYFDWC